ncbi:MAG TPA: TIGR01777 family oxidoreductase, partial [Gemmataceae bacterium]|nr:TIGR01777 family oxidoreductase [Gemmataceae bacterium]
VVRLVSGSVPQSPPDDGTTYVPWNPQAPIDPATLAGCDALVHLAGDNIAEGKWTEAKRKKITESRTVPTKHLADAIAVLPPDRRPKVFACASAVGFYGDRGDEELTEQSSSGSGFLADVCKRWEDMTTPAVAAGVRVVNLRTGAVLSPKTGALGKQLPAFKAGAGAVLGSGKQWIAWITLNDLLGAIHHCLMTESLRGPVNLVGPGPATNRDFTKALGRVLGRPAFLWLPRSALRVMFGELADAALLASLRAVPRKLLDTGFVFDHVELEPALRFLLGR